MHSQDPASNAWIVGGGSGHGFKHGPAMGEHVARVVLGDSPPEPLFSFARFQKAGSEGSSPGAGAPTTV